MNDEDAVREANERFYRAIESLSIEAMDAVWAHGDHAQCVHPGWDLLVGWDAVRKSWEIIFKNTTEIRFTLGDVRVRMEGAMAWVTCTENILSQSRGNVSVTSVLATNLFARGAGEWQMIHHHASHVFPEPPPPETAE
jgi:ketosteroid isomerase-like protein